MPLALTSTDLARMKSQVEGAGRAMAKYKDKLETAAEQGIEVLTSGATGFALGALDRYAKDNAPAGTTVTEFGLFGIPGTLGVGVGAHVAAFWLGAKAAPIARSVGTAAIAAFGYAQGSKLHKDSAKGWTLSGGGESALPDGGARGGTRLSDEELRAVAAGRV